MSLAVEGKIGNELIGGMVQRDERVLHHLRSETSARGFERSLFQQAFITARQLHPTLPRQGAFSI